MRRQRNLRWTAGQPQNCSTGRMDSRDTNSAAVSSLSTCLSVSQSVSMYCSRCRAAHPIQTLDCGGKISPFRFGKSSFSRFDYRAEMKYARARNLLPLPVQPAHVYLTHPPPPSPPHLLVYFLLLISYTRVTPCCADTTTAKNNNHAACCSVGSRSTYSPLINRSSRSVVLVNRLYMSIVRL